MQLGITIRLLHNKKDGELKGLKANSADSIPYYTRKANVIHYCSKGAKNEVVTQMHLNLQIFCVLSHTLRITRS